MKISMTPSAQRDNIKPVFRLIRILFIQNKRRFEDRDYWLRLHQAGYELIKAGWVKHIGNATSGKLPDLHEFYQENERRFKEKYAGL
jgi:GT2 family glycosyltransferase